MRIANFRFAEAEAANHVQRPRDFRHDGTNKKNPIVVESVVSDIKFCNLLSKTFPLVSGCTSSSFCSFSLQILIFLCSWWWRRSNSKKPSEDYNLARELLPFFHKNMHSLNTDKHHAPWQDCAFWNQTIKAVIFINCLISSIEGRR